jgi:hypothetical protein
MTNFINIVFICAYETENDLICALCIMSRLYPKLIFYGYI